MKMLIQQMVDVKLVHVSSPEPIFLNDIIASFLRQVCYMYLQGHSMCHIGHAGWHGNSQSSYSMS